MKCFVVDDEKIALDRMVRELKNAEPEAEVSAFSAPNDLLDYAKENPQVVEDFLRDYEASIQYMNDPTQRQDAAKLVAEHGITANEAIAVNAIHFVV